MENVRTIIGSEWYDDDMFVIDFAPCPSKDSDVEGVIEAVSVFYHKDLGTWSVDKLYFDSEYNYVGYDSDDLPPDEREEYIRLGEIEIEKKIM